MKIVLLQPPVWGIFEPPIALAQLSACLKAAGHTVTAGDMNIFLYNRRSEKYRNEWAIERSSFWCNKDSVECFFSENERLINDYLDDIVRASPRMVCLSVNTASLHATILLARLLRAKDPTVRILVGGPVFLVPFDPKPIFDTGVVDIIVRGEAEETLVDVTRFIEQGLPLDGCEGIVFLNNGVIVTNAPRPLLRNLDALPFLDFSDMPFAAYDPPGHLRNHISVMTSRGCVQSCVFCGPRAYWSGYRTMSGRRIYEEIRQQVGHCPDTEVIEFLDLLVNGNMQTLVDFCDLMAAQPLGKKLQWRANLIVRPEMTRAVFAKMKKAGCIHVTFGIESGSQHVLELMRKKYKIIDADNALRAAHEEGIKVTCNFMFGFPGESREDFRETLDFLSRNRIAITIAYPSRTFCTIEPYSYLQGHLKEFNMIANQHHGQYWVSKDGENTYIERMKRCEEFSRHAISLGVDVGLGLQTSFELDHWLNLGDYYNSTGDRAQAIYCYEKYRELDPENAGIKEKILTLKTGESKNEK
jgi:radical SAM superfamily enzyme YgiQ (UPF0313 family)